MKKKVIGLAAVVGSVVLIGLLVQYGMKNWGKLANAAVNGVATTVTGKDSNFQGFTSGTASDTTIDWGE